MDIGIDIGGSLAKVVFLTEQEEIQFTTLATTDTQEIVAYLQRFSDSAMYATGCGARRLQEAWPGEVKVTDELESFCIGARYLLQRSNYGQEFILVSFGTGTSIFHVTDQHWERVAGTGVGGGTITGLGKLLVGTDDFDQLVGMAAGGNRKNVDLMVSDLYPDLNAPVLSELTAANFGKNESNEPPREDVASALIQLVIETISVLAIQVAQTFGLDRVAFGGSPSQTLLIQERLREIGSVFGKNFGFVPSGPYCGAVGAIRLHKR